MGGVVGEQVVLAFDVSVAYVPCRVHRMSFAEQPRQRRSFRGCRAWGPRLAERPLSHTDTLPSTLLPSPPMRLPQSVTNVDPVYVYRAGLTGMGASALSLAYLATLARPCGKGACCRVKVRGEMRQLFGGSGLLAGVGCDQMRRRAKPLPSRRD